MTDEEIADKYVIDSGNNDCTIEAFLAGLKAGRPKWHKVADGDLPEKNKLVFIRLVGCCVLGWYDGIDFYNDCDSQKIISKEILTAWCEIPKYTEE